jgi:hypothetical protein
MSAGASGSNAVVQFGPILHVSMSAITSEVTALPCSIGGRSAVMLGTAAGSCCVPVSASAQTV